MITMPKNAKATQMNNRSVAGKEHLPLCEVCFGPVNPARAKRVWYDGFDDQVLTAAEAAERQQRSDPSSALYLTHIGSDCWKAHPELHPYQIKETGA